VRRSTLVQFFAAVVLATVGSHSFLPNSTPAPSESEQAAASETKAKVAKRHENAKKSNESDAGQGAKPTETEPEHGGFEGPWLATSVYFGHEPPKWGLPTEDDVRQGADYLWHTYFRVTPPPQTRLHALIATIPDPMHSHLALRTDRVLTSIYRAMNEQGWDFAGQWLPWAPPDQNSNSGDGGGGDEEEQHRVEARAEQPGVLLFRKDGAAVLIFIVGETPTAGIDKRQFENAVAYVRNLQGGFGGEKEKVGVLGPSYSGSFASLLEVLARGREQHLDFRVVNYGATRKDLNDEYQARIIQHLEDEYGMTWANINDDFAEGALWGDCTKHDSIQKLDLPVRDVVTISEAGTAYGREKDTQYFFPREISWLRNAYPDGTGKGTNQGAGAAAMSLSLKDDKNFGDAIPTYADGHFAQSQNAELLELIDHLHHEHTRLATILATNPLDMLFLARLMRQQLPDVRLLLRDADLMLPQTAAQDNLTGTLVLTASAGPLDLRATDSGVGSIHEIWPDTFAEWAYFGCVDLVKAWGGKEESRGLQGLWLMAVTPHGFAPIARYEYLPKMTHQPRVWPQPSRFWVVTVLCLSLIAILLFAGTLKTDEKRSTPWNRFAISKVENSKAARMFYLAAIHMNVAGMLFLVTVPAFGLIFEDERLVQAVRGVGVFALLVVTLSSIRLFLQQWFCVLDGPSKGHAIVKNAFFWMLLLLALVVVPVGWVMCCRQNPQNWEGHLFRYRALHLFVGASPVLPLLSLAAGFTFVYLMHLTRVSSTEGLRMLFPVRALDEHFQQRFQERARLLRKMCSAIGFIALPRTKGALWAGLGLYFAAAVVTMPWRFLNGVEGGAFTYPFTALFVLYVLTILFACLRLSQGWSLLRQMLEELATLPPGANFERFENVIGSGAIWTQIRRVRTVDTVRASLPLVQQIAKNGAGPVLDRLCSKYQVAAEELLACECKPEKRSTVINRLYVCGFRLSDYLVKHGLWKWWQAEKATPQANAAAEPESDGPSVPAKPTDPATDFVLLQLIAYIRVCMLQLRTLTYLIVGAFMFLVLAINSYAIQAPLMMGRFLFVVFLVLGAVIVRTSTSMQRNKILSRLSAGVSGKVDLEFVLKMVSVGILPLLGLLSALFPSVSGILFKWVQPGIEALR